MSPSRTKGAACETAREERRMKPEPELPLPGGWPFTYSLEATDRVATTSVTK
jgi:hypothetical protein